MQLRYLLFVLLISLVSACERVSSSDETKPAVVPPLKSQSLTEKNTQVIDSRTNFDTKITKIAKGVKFGDPDATLEALQRLETQKDKCETTAR